MDLALKNPQRLICHKPKQPNNQPSTYVSCSSCLEPDYANRIK